MRIKEYFKSKPVFSLEIFPPKLRVSPGRGVGDHCCPL